jgi:hypothetical protein
MCHEINLTSFSSIICVTFPSTSYIFLHYALFFNISNYIINISDFFLSPKVYIEMEGGMQSDGYVALDNFVFEHRSECPTFPHYAVPGYTTTTAAPTQPSFPNCDFEGGECGWMATEGPVRWTRTDDSQLVANNQTAPAPGHGNLQVHFLKLKGIGSRDWGGLQIVSL